MYEVLSRYTLWYAFNGFWPVKRNLPSIPKVTKFCCCIRPLERQKKKKKKYSFTTSYWYNSAVEAPKYTRFVASYLRIVALFAHAKKGAVTRYTSSIGLEPLQNNFFWFVSSRRQRHHSLALEFVYIYTCTNGWLVVFCCFGLQHNYVTTIRIYIFVFCLSLLFANLIAQ